MIIDLCLFEEGTLPGIAVLLNMDKVSLSHLSRVDLTVAQQFFYFIQVCFCCYQTLYRRKNNLRGVMGHPDGT